MRKLKVSNSYFGDYSMFPSQPALLLSPAPSQPSPISILNSSNLFAQTTVQREDVREIKKLEQLLLVIEQTSQETFAVKSKEVVLVLGPTGAGKSTFINYMAQRTMRRHSDQLSLEDTVICEEPVAAIGHGIESCTSRPKIFPTNLPELFFCDCPGFFETRGVNIQIANAFGIQAVAKNSQKIKGIVLLVESSSLISERGQDLDNTIQFMLDFLGQGCEENDLKSIFVLLSKVSREKVDAAMATFTRLASRNPLCANLLEMGNVGAYSPVDDFASNPHVYTRQTILDKIHIFPGIEDSEDTFRIALCPEAELYVLQMASLINSQIRTAIGVSNFAVIPKLLQSIFTLQILKVSAVDEEYRKIAIMLNGRIALLGSGDEKSRGVLTELMQVMPTIFHPTIQEAMHSLDGKLEKEKQQQEEQEKTALELKQADENIKGLQSAHEKLNTSLQEAKISEKEFKEQNLHLQQQLLDITKSFQDLTGKLTSLQSDREKDRAEALKKEELLAAQLKKTQEVADEKIAKLQKEITERPQQPQIMMMPMMGGGGGPFDGMMGGQFGGESFFGGGHRSSGGSGRRPGRPVGSRDSYQRTRTCSRK